jgi:signal transduction histidine kinase
MGWLNVRRPQGRDLVAAVTVAVVYPLALWLALEHGWHPRELRQFVLAGAFTVGVLLTRERWPLCTLLVVSLGYPAVYGTFLQVELFVLPILLAAYSVAARGRLRTVWVLLLVGGAVTAMLWPLKDLFSVVTQSDQLWRLNLSKFVLVESLALLFVLLGRASYLHKQTTAQLVTRNQELERLRSVETVQVVSAERTRIARELHDVVAHHISAVVIRAQAADRVADTRPEEIREAVRWIAANGQETLVAMRQVVKVLRSAESGSALTPQTTLAELPEIAERMSAVGLPVELRLPPVVPALPAGVELAIVRIVQEALTNVLVHARATRSLVELSLSGDELRLEVHDNGSAKSPPTAPIRILAASVTGAARPAEQKLPISATALGGNGLIGMRERAASCGGVLSIGTSPLGGWLVTATLRSNLGVAISPSAPSWPGAATPDQVPEKDSGPEPAADPVPGSASATVLQDGTRSVRASRAAW